jgi:hypothetical protein
MADAIKDCSRRNGLVLDPFAGSGTVLIAAERIRRKWHRELRQKLQSENQDALRHVAAPDIPNFMLLGRRIGVVGPREKESRYLQESASHLFSSRDDGAALAKASHNGETDCVARTAKASRISRHAVKSQCACEWDGWGRLSDDGPGQNNPDLSEGPWGRWSNSTAWWCMIESSFRKRLTFVARLTGPKRKTPSLLC